VIRLVVAIAKEAAEGGFFPEGKASISYDHHPKKAQQGLLLPL